MVYCLPIQPAEGNIAIIGQNFMTGYRMVFDRENMKLGWSRSDCEDLSAGQSTPSTSPSAGKAPNPLPTNEQQHAPARPAVAPAIAGRAPPKTSSSSSLHKESLWAPFSTLLSLLASFLLLRHLEPAIRLDLV